MAQSSGSDRHTTALNSNPDRMQRQQGALALSHASREQVRLVPDTVRQIRSLLTSGSQAREKLSAGLQDILHGCNAKESERVRELLDDMARVVTEFSVEESAFKVGRRLLTRLFGENPSAGFCQQCASVRDQADAMGNTLEQCQHELLQNIAKLERRYQENLECYLRLESYIDAGQEKLHQLNEALAPGESSAASAAAGRLRVAQLTDLGEELKNLRRTLDDTMPTLSCLRIYQDSQKALVNKIHTTMADALLRWRDQLTQTVVVLGGATTSAKSSPAKGYANEALVETSRHPRKAASTNESALPAGAVVDAAAMKEMQLALIAVIKETQLVAANASRRRADTGDQLQRWCKHLLTLDSGKHQR